MTNRSNTVAFALVTLIVLAAADPALAQFTGTGTVPFRTGLNTALNWVYIIAVAVALFGFIGACIAIFMRNIIGFAGGVLAVIVGGALLANAGTLVQSLTGLKTLI